MIALVVVLIFMVLLGAFTLMYQLYRLVVLDAESRGLKHPKFLGLFSISAGSGTGGIILYLIGRNKYPSHMTDEVKLVFNARKKKTALSLVCIAIGAIGTICIALFGGI